MKCTIIRSLSALIILLFWQHDIYAQAIGSVATYGGSTATIDITSGGTHIDAAETIYIGPGSYIIDGTWEIYSKNIVIDPSAVITGTGNIHFFNPSVVGGIASSTFIDGNAGSTSIEVNMVLDNASGMALTNINFPSELTSAGFTDNTSASGIYVGKDLSLNVDGADITLGTVVTGDLVFDANATISNYRPARMVITNNSILSHVIKQAFTSAFTFPVGIADGDYTPAQITNVGAIDVSVSVQDYTGSHSHEISGSTGNGMERTWHIFGSAAGSGTTINLQHNTGTNQSTFDNASHFVTRFTYSATNNTGDNTQSINSWQSNTLGAGATGDLVTPAGTLAGSSMRSRAYSTLATSAVAGESYFSKTSNSVKPLPVTLVSFKASANNCDAMLEWTTVSEQNLRHFEIERSTNGSHWVMLAIVTATGNSNSAINYRHPAILQPGVANFFRLKMLDENGKSDYSSINKVSCSSKVTNVSVSPNPTTGNVTICGMESNTQKEIKVTNVCGQVVLAFTTNSNILQMDLSRLSSGIYHLQVMQDNSMVFDQKVIKQ